MCTCLCFLHRHHLFELVSRQLHSARPALPDVPAVYFISPTLENVRRIAEDLDNGLYESFHLNFVEPLPRALLEELAAAAANNGTGEFVEQVLRSQVSSQLQLTPSIVQVVDQYLSFISPSPSLFSLLPAPAKAVAPNSTPSPTPTTSYALLNSPSASEQDIEDETERIANGLFCAIATLG